MQHRHFALFTNKLRDNLETDETIIIFDYNKKTYDIF